MCKFRLLKANEIDCRVGQVINTERFQGVTLLLYKDARVDMALLDETVGALNWQRKHEVVNGNMFCTVSIWDDVKGEWVSKADCGVESNTEKEKGQSSDSFKRACVCWGIGRELYTAPQILIKCELDQGKVARGLGWIVKEIGYNADREITSLVIEETKYGKEGAIVYTYGSQNQPRTNEKPKSEKKVEKKTNEPPKAVHDIEWAKKVTFKNKKGEDVLVDSLPDEWLERLITTKDEDLADARESAKIIYRERANQGE